MSLDDSVRHYKELLRKVPDELHGEAFEFYLEGCEIYKSEHGSEKFNPRGDDYFKNMNKRYEFAVKYALERVGVKE